MKHRTTIALTALLLTCVVTAQAQDAAACRELLRDALRQHHTVPDSGVAVRRRIRVTTVRMVDWRPDTTVNIAETIEWNGGNVVRAEGTEVWSDEETLVMIEERTKRIRFVDLKEKRDVVAAQGLFGAAFPDSLTAYGRLFRCEEINEKSEARTRVNCTVDSSMQRFFNAVSMTVEVDQRGEIVRMAIVHPGNSPVRATEYTVESIDRAYSEPGLPGPVRALFLDENGKLKAEFEGYRASG